MSTKMSHRKAFSQGSIPFSWEDSPGISKFIHQDCAPLLTCQSSSSPSNSMQLAPDSGTVTNNMLAQGLKIPLPPCIKKMEQPPRRSISIKGFRWSQEDPFLAAYRHCAKNAENQRKKSTAAGSKAKRTKHIFTCKNSCDVKEDNLVRLSNLPPIPRERVRGR